ncbi:MAG: hypothetical protein AB7O59_21220 [Pirellulales bacterium]
MRRICVGFLGLGACAIVAIGISHASAAEPQRETGPSYWMKKKLEYSERLLSGLASGDFGEIGQSARSMRALSHLERFGHASFPGYRAQLKHFETANDSIVTAADKEDLDGAAEGFVKLTMSCVHCHKVVRDVQRTAAPAPAEPK